MDIETRHPLIEQILAPWRDRIGGDYEGYRGHVYRMFNFCLGLRTGTEEEKTKLAIAACFHDIGLWSDDTLDYIEPSVLQAKKYLAEAGLGSWTQEIGLMIEMHHKLRPCRDDRYPLVEVFRKGDLVDFSWGVFNFGLPRNFVRGVKDRIPNAGFHKFLLRRATGWFVKHPLNPVPFMKW